MKLIRFALAAVALAASAVHAAPIVVANTDATQLANAIAGSGVTISNATLTYSGSSTLPAPTGTFSGGASTVGFDSGILLTNGTIACAQTGNTSGSCGQNRGGSQDTTSLRFDFVSGTGNIFFRYVFASEEYNEYVNQGVNDAFQLLLNGTNIGVLPGSGSEVSIDNVNCLSQSAFYRNNSAAPSGAPNCANLNLNIQYDGLTTVLTASATGLTGLNSFEFRIFDRGDNILDSGVFIQAGSFSGNNNVPVPGVLALAGLGLMGAGAMRRRQG